MEVIARLNEYINQEKPCALVTVTSGAGSGPASVGSMLLASAEGLVTGTVGGGNLEHMALAEAADAIEKGIDREIEYNLKSDAMMNCGGSVKLFIKVFGRNPKLFIAGAGHVGSELYALAVQFGFSVTVIDDRPDMADKSRFPEAKEAVCGDFYEILKSLDMKDSYVAIASRSHDTDESALFAAAGSGAKYVGMLGSTSKIKTLFGSLRQKGVPDDFLKSVYAPMGLNIATASPKEIALSILSEIILVKNSGTPLHMKDTKKIF